MEFICKDIFTIVVWALTRQLTNTYAKSFYCSSFGLNMKSGQIHRNILNIEMNMRESTIGLNILKDCRGICGDFIFTTVCRESVQ
jgi:hypothetical protein